MWEWILPLVGGALALLWLAISGMAKAGIHMKQEHAKVDALKARLEIENEVSIAPDVAAAARASGLVRKPRE